MRHWGLRLLGAATIGLVLMVAAEVVLRALPIVSGVHRQDPRSSASSARLLPNRDYNWSMGWDLRHVVSGRTNGMGFLSPHEYTADKRAVALLGDSFVEAQMLRYDESLAGRLDALWAGRAVAFNFGLSGAALPHYLGIAREMGEQFRFAAAVVVVTPSDYVEGFEKQEGLYSWGEDPDRELVKLVPAAPRAGWKQFAREMALVRYVRANLHLTPSRLRGAPRQPACVPQALTELDRRRLSAYMEALPLALHLDPRRIVVVFNASARQVYERVDHNRSRGASDCPDRDTLARAELERLVASHGMKSVDVDRLLEDHYRKYRRPLDFAPVDSHWNGTAISMVAQEIDALLADELGRKPRKLKGQLLTAAPR